MGLHRRLYHWMLSFSGTPYAVPALFAFAFAESSFFPIPPDVLLIFMALKTRASWARYALVCSIASVLGGLAGYGIGALLWDIEGVRSFFFDYVPGVTPGSFARFQAVYADWDFLIVFTAGFTPVPYKLITITAGVAGISLPMFVLASAISRSARFFIVAWLVQRFGPGAQEFIERRFNLLSILFVVLLVGGFLVVKYLGGGDPAGH
ncbi:MAG: YqaA family protein [Planctomycetota bacterium]